VRRSRAWAWLAGAILALVVPATASAFLKDVQEVVQQHVSTSTPTQNETLNCPASKTWIATGATAFGLEDTELGLFQMGPVGIDFDSFFGEAAETDPLDGNWSLTVHGICVQPTATPPPAGGAGTYVKDVKVKRAISVFSSSDKAILAECKGGRSPIAGGGGIFTKGANKGVAFNALSPPASPAAWSATAQETDPTGHDWKLSASVVCADLFNETDTSNYAGPFTQSNRATSAVNSKPTKTISQNCPDAYRVVGGGALIRDATKGFVGDPDVVITRSEPAKIKHGQAKRWVAEATELDNTDLEWSVEAYIVCTELDAGPPD
jgi:hypothetical protein